MGGDLCGDHRLHMRMQLCAQLPTDLVFLRLFGTPSTSAILDQTQFLEHSCMVGINLRVPLGDLDAVGSGLGGGFLNTLLDASDGLERLDGVLLNLDL